MADLDDLREGADFGLGINCENQSFHVKGAENLPWGMKDRLSRIFNPKTGKAVMLAFDHGFIMGPTSGLERIDLNIVPLIEYADCLMCTRGILQSTIPANTTKPICLRSDAGTSILDDFFKLGQVPVTPFGVLFQIAAEGLREVGGQPAHQRIAASSRSCPLVKRPVLPDAMKLSASAAAFRLSPLGSSGANVNGMRPVFTICLNTARTTDERSKP